MTYNLKVFLYKGVYPSKNKAIFGFKEGYLNCKSYPRVTHRKFYLIIDNVL